MELFYLQLTILAFLLTVLGFSLTVGAFLLTIEVFVYSGHLGVIRALRDCKQRSSTVSKKTPIVSRNASPSQNYFWGALGGLGGYCKSMLPSLL